MLLFLLMVGPKTIYHKCNLDFLTIILHFNSLDLFISSGLQATSKFDTDIHVTNTRPRWHRIDMVCLCFGAVHEWSRGPRFWEATAQIRHFITAVWGRFWAPFPTDSCLEEAGLSGSRVEPCIRLHFESVTLCNSMWFQFDPSQKCPHSSLFTSNGTSSIIPCVIRVTTDYVSAWLPTK